MNMQLKTLIYSLFGTRITQVLPAVCAPELNGTLQQTAGELSSNTSVRAVSNVSMNKYVGTK